MAPAAAQQQQPPPPAYTTTPSSTSTTSGGMSRSSLSLPVAAQPDMVLAWEKDGFYAKQIHQQLKVRPVSVSPAMCVLHDYPSPLTLTLLPIHPQTPGRVRGRVRGAARGAAGAGDGGAGGPALLRADRLWRCVRRGSFHDIDSIGSIEALTHPTFQTNADTGMETLGQEYGHLMFVEQRSAGRFLPLSRLRQAVLVGATVVCNYVSEVMLRCAFAL